jgi:hypothetical protein
LQVALYISPCWFLNHLSGLNRLSLVEESALG